jgi:glucose/arabinose dehydrogenase
LRTKIWNIQHLIVLFSLIFLISSCDSSESNAAESSSAAVAATLPAATPSADEEVVATEKEEESQTQSSAPTSAPESQEASSTPSPTTTAPTSTPPVEASPTVERPSLESLAIELLPVAGGFTKLVYLTHAGDGTGRLFVVEQAGRILILKDGATSSTPFLDIVSIVGSSANEQGLLSVAFHPDYLNNGFFFVNYTDKQGDTVIARYQVSADNPEVADPNSAKILLTIDQPYANHNGGQVEFGPDGYLYIGMGDGGAANDPENRGQSLNTLLGKILRIEVDTGDPYGIPETNPFVNQSEASPEIWSYGWRNPWRFSFDRATGDLYVGDVGQNQYEEVDVELAGAEGGQNYGWRLMEGQHCFSPAECDPAAQGLTLPVAEYNHGLGCSVTGGYVYRGKQFPALEGVYFYGDYCTGIIWGLRHEGNEQWSQVELLHSEETISSFGQDEAGELYLIDHRGGILQVAAK